MGSVGRLAGFVGRPIGPRRVVAANRRTVLKKWSSATFRMMRNLDTPSRTRDNPPMIRRLLAPLLALVPLVAPSAQAPARPRITGVSHIGLLVHDLPASLAFYQDFVGFQEQFRLNKPSGDVDLAFIKINDRQWVELFAEAAPNSDRLHQVALEVEDAEAMRAFLGSKGIKVPERLSPGRVGNLSFSVTDPDGHLVEFVQVLPAGWTAKDRGKHLADGRVSARLKHIGFSVGSLDKAMAFYRDVLGFQETWRGAANPQQLSWVNMRVPDGDEYVEFMLYAEMPTLGQLGPMNHMSLEVPDVGAAKRVLDARTARAAYARAVEFKTGINRKRQLNLFDPDGTRVELMEAGTVDGIPAPSSTAPPPLRR
jgi:catechol 2,3-dioxygenase-like lactoylglutathione lyase family enzyme